MSSSSIYKTLHYIECVSSADCIVEVGNEKIHMARRPAINISKTMWHKDYCNCCGQCCRNYDTIFSSAEMEEVKKHADPGHLEIIELAREKEIFVNGQRNIYYEVPPMRNSEGHDIWVTSHTTRNCRFVDLQPDGTTKYCRIHTYRPITCGFPHMELRYNPHEPHICSLRHVQFGRNHLLGCNVDIKTFEYDEETYQSDLYWLHRLDDFAKTYDIPTFLPKIIDYIESIDWRNPPTQDILIQNRRSILGN